MLASVCVAKTNDNDAVTLCQVCSFVAQTSIQLPTMSMIGVSHMAVCSHGQAQAAMCLCVRVGRHLALHSLCQGVHRLRAAAIHLMDLNTATPGRSARLGRLTRMLQLKTDTTKLKLKVQEEPEKRTTMW